MKYQTFKVRDVWINDDKLVEKLKFIYAPEALTF